MHEYISILSQTPLFHGIPHDACAALIPLLRPHTVHATKGDYLLRVGEPCCEIGILLTGHATAVHHCADGSQTPAAHLEQGSIFGDVLSGASVTSPVSILASTDCTALFFPYDALLSLEHTTAHPAHTQLLKNLLRAVSDKYFALSRRIDFLVLKTLRAKIAAFLLSWAEQTHSDSFSIPFTRAQLADYLGCERSALCRTLSSMQREGLFETYRDSFKLLDTQALNRLC